jgi:hypothetical protein
MQYGMFAYTKDVFNTRDGIVSATEHWICLSSCDRYDTGVITFLLQLDRLPL